MPHIIIWSSYFDVPGFDWYICVSVVRDFTFILWLFLYEYHSVTDFNLFTFMRLSRNMASPTLFSTDFQKERGTYSIQFVCIFFSLDFIQIEIQRSAYLLNVRVSSTSKRKNVKWVTFTHILGYLLCWGYEIHKNTPIIRI